MNPTIIACITKNNVSQNACYKINKDKTGKPQ